ncbi:serine/threonine protein kinase [Actinomadura sp. KC06]|uniref:serine/threonine-protein kinase n=1 Tax=Actinomadura sp. KC06 TaxID=2530369 RepID=UPI001046B85C|nr:serine/threonine-protein kinase [Actinomadura sp. KC06]TDD28387.1 serine/threonine protein kinase [Actinomadura sp. KC06]
MSATPLEPGDPSHVGPWELLGRLGEGGQGVVYLGGNPSGERVAVKVLRGLDRDALRRMEREVEAARRVAPSCTVRIVDVRLEQTVAYVVTEYVDGPSLQDAVRTEGPRRGAALERLAVDTASALATVHAAGIVHRDFKPHNVLLGPDGPRIIDFGIARALDMTSSLTKGPIGTPAYMAPEQIEGRPVTAAADVFAWGAVMVFAATGRPAFARDGMQALFHQILSEEPDLSGLDWRLRDVVRSCLAKDPAHRPAASELVARLTGQNAAFMPVPPPGPVAPPAPTLPSAWPRKRRVWPWLVPAIALPVVAAIAVGGVLVGRQLLKSEVTATSFPDTCKLYDSGDGKKVLSDMGAANGKRIPQGNKDQYGEWRLCAFGTARFPPKNTSRSSSTSTSRTTPRPASNGPATP